MGYTTVRDRTGAVAAAAALAGREDAVSAGLVVDQVMAESGVADRTIARAALAQAGGDVARACSLVRAWAAVLPRAGTARESIASLRVDRRITPGFASPSGGQYLGASRDYEQRLLDLDGPRPPAKENGSSPSGGIAASAQVARTQPFSRALDGLTRDGLVASPHPRAVATDITREATDRSRRGALLQLLARAETGAMTALAYTAIRGNSSRQDPTLAELRRGNLPVHMERPDGARFVVGEVGLAYAEIVLYRLHGGVTDPQLTLGVGATVGAIERRAIAAGVLDANCARSTGLSGRLEPAEDAEFLAMALDGQEASGFVEHLKLPHHVTFTSELDRIRQSRSSET